MGWLRKTIVGIIGFGMGYAGSFSVATFGTLEGIAVGATVATTAVVAEHILSGGFSGEKAPDVCVKEKNRILKEKKTNAKKLISNAVKNKEISREKAEELLINLDKIHNVIER